MAVLSPNQQRVAEIARSIVQKNPVYLDSETTGLDKNAEIVEIAVVDDNGAILIDQLVRPSQPIPAEVTRLHGITDEMVATAKSWPALWPTVRGILLGKTVGIYNAEFDVRIMRQSLERYRLTWRESLSTLDILSLFSEFRGEWDPNRRALRRFRLEDAGQFFRIALPNSHRAADDALLARALLRRIGGLEY
ncbi:MAG TPA: 3'-5' exonuclease [Bellilinea sp.]